MNAAESLFLEQGVTSTSVDEIVTAADVAKGTFYIHFKSKEELLVAMRQRFGTDLCGELDRAMNRCRSDDWLGRLQAWLAAGIDGYFERTTLHDVLFREFRPSHPQLQHVNPIVDQLAEFLDRGGRARAWSAESPHLTAVMLFQALHGSIDDAIGRRPRVNRKQLYRLLEVFFRRALDVEAGPLVDE